MQEVAKTTIEWDGTDKHAHEIQDTLGYYEDGVICLSGKYSGFKFATLEQACNFAIGGNRNPAYHVSFPFGWHGVWNNINHETGFVSPVCEHEDGNCDCAKSHKDYLLNMEK